MRGCLAKDPAERWQSAADVVKQIRWIAEDSAQPPEIGTTTRPVPRRERAIWAAALMVLAVGLAVAIVRTSLARPTPAATIRFEIPPPAGGVFPGANSTPRLAVSPDGNYVAYTVNLGDGKADQLWIRRLDSLQPTALVTTGEVTSEYVQQPFWSPDSRFVGFFVDGKLKKVDVVGGVVQTLCNVPGNNYGGTWSADGTILFSATLTQGLQRVSAGGGVPSQVTRLESTEAAHLWPRFLPDGRHFLDQALGTSDNRAVYVGSLDEPTRKKLFTSLLMADFAPPDHLLFIRERTLPAQRFDVDRLELQGEPTAVAEGVQASQGNGRVGFRVSANGVLVYRAGAGSGTGDSQLVWVDRSGKEITTIGPPATIRGLDVSPTRDRSVIHREEGTGAGDLWISDLERGSTSRLTFNPASHYMAPVWSPDGRRIIFSKTTTLGVWVISEKDANGVGDERLVLESKTALVPWSVIPMERRSCSRSRTTSPDSTCDDAISGRRTVVVNWDAALKR